jgi:anti-sigma factor RsiW
MKDRGTKQNMEHSLCHDRLGQLSAYLDGEAAQSICDEIARHLHSCSNCRAVVNTLERTVTLYRTLPSTEVPAGVQERLLRVLQL